MHYKKSVFRSLAMVTQLGISVMTPAFLCIYAGHQIDSRFGTNWMVPLLILGIAAGARCAWILVKRVTAQERREDEMIRRELESRNTREGISKPKQPSRIRKETGAADEGAD